jgi:translation initiation factor IF-3
VTTFRINDAIMSREVLLIDDEGTKLGVMSADDARAMARRKGLDLVEVSAASRPPVCKIMDFGKFKYEQKKKSKQTRRKVHVGQIKEIRLRPRTDKHDLEFKVNHGREFLSEGCRLQVTIVFRGREMSRTDLGFTVLKDITARLDDVAKVERPPRQEGKRLSILFCPKGKTDGKVKDKKVDSQAVQNQPPGKGPVQALGQGTPAVGQAVRPPAPPPVVGPPGQPADRA